MTPIANITAAVIAFTVSVNTPVTAQPASTGAGPIR